MENSVIDINQIGTWIVGIILLLGIISVISAITYFIFFRRKRTRENFAFAGLSTLSILIANALVVITSDKILLNIIREILNQLGWKIPPLKLDVFDKYIIVVFILAMAAFIVSIFYIWSTKSILEKEIKIFQAAWNYFQTYLKKDKVITSVPTEKETKIDIFSPMSTEQLPWFIQAAQLLELIDKQYQIDLGDYELAKQNLATKKDIGEDWFSEKQCFLAKYGHLPIVILCTATTPTLKIVQDVYEFTCQQVGKPSKVLIFIEQGKEERYTIKTNTYTIEYRYKQELVEQLINFSGYKKYLQYLFSKKKLPNSKNTLAQIYTPLSAIHRPLKDNKLDKGKAITNAEAYVLDWIKKEVPTKEHLAILGQYGQGKSVLSQKIALAILENPQAYDRIPIIIELRGSSPRNMSLLDLLARFAAPYAISPIALFRLHQMGKLVIILEAFDEMDLVGDAVLLKAHFKRLWQFAITPNAKIIITGRPNLFIDDVRRREALGIYTRRTSLPYTRAIELQQMDDTQVKQALRNTLDQVKNGIGKALQKAGHNTSFDELVRRPSTLHQLSVVWGKVEQKWVQNLNAATVIQQFIYYDYERQEKKYLQEHHTSKPLVTVGERHYFMQGIALGIVLQDGYSNQINQEQLRGLVKKLWNNFPAQLPPYKEANIGTIKCKLKDRFPREHGFETILNDIKASGILVEDMHGANRFKFAHKSYLEILISDFYTNFILKDRYNAYDLLIANTIAQVFTFKKEKLPYSPDIENFISQLIASRIKLKDKKGNYIAIQEKPEKYSQAIYNKLFPNKFSQWFPNFISRINLTSDFKFLIPLIIVQLIIHFIQKLLNTPSLFVFSLGVILLVFVFSFIYRKKMFVSSTEYWTRLGLWYATKQQLDMGKSTKIIDPTINMLLVFKYKKIVTFYEGVLLLHVQQISILALIVFSIYLVANSEATDMHYLTGALLTAVILNRILIYLSSVKEKSNLLVSYKFAVIIGTSSIFSVISSIYIIYNIIYNISSIFIADNNSIMTLSVFSSICIIISSIFSIVVFSRSSNIISILNSIFSFNSIVVFSSITLFSVIISSDISSDSMHPKIILLLGFFLSALYTIISTWHIHRLKKQVKNSEASA